MKRVLPTSDLCFKKILASEENKDILAGLIDDFFDTKAEDIVINNPYSIAIYKEFAAGQEISKLRETLRDIGASFKVADFISEVQIRRTEFFDERVIYYPFDRFCQNYNMVGAMKFDADGKPIRFSSLRPIYSLNILGYTHFNDDEALRILELYDPKRDKRLDTQLVRIGFFELTKNNIETANQQYWREFFLTGDAHPDAPCYIKKASQVIDYINLSEEERNMISTLERLEATAQVEREYIRTEGRAEGRAEERAEIVRTMLNEKFAPEMIVKITGCSLEFIKSQMEGIVR